EIPVTAERRLARPLLKRRALERNRHRGRMSSVAQWPCMPTVDSTASNIVATIAVRFTAACVALLLSGTPLNAHSAAGDDSDIAVHAERNGSQVIIDIRMNLDAPAALTWQVMTDYDRMADYISNLELSRILSRDGNHLT